MPHINLYVPKELDNEIRRLAKLQKKALSAFLTSLLQQVISNIGYKKQNKTLSNVVGRWKGEFPQIKRDLPEDL